MKIAVLGGGMIGSVIAKMLRKDHDILIVDSADRAPGCAITYEEYFQSHYKKEDDLIVNALPGKVGFDALTMAVACGKNVVDVSFWDYSAARVEALDKKAKEKGVTVFFDLGWSPGMTNILIGQAMAELDDVVSVEYYVGGLPQSGPYKSPYCVEDSMKFVFGTWLRLTTLHGNLDVALCNFERRSLPKTCYPYTYRPEFFGDEIENLEDMGFFKPENLPHTTEILRNEWATDENYRDISYMDIYVRSKKKTIEYHMVDKYCEASKTTSMAKLTATTAVLGVSLFKFLDEALMGIRPGLVPPEELGRASVFGHFWEGWKSAGIVIERTET